MIASGTAISFITFDKLQSVENTWADKIDYTLSTPTKAVIFGTAIQVNFRSVSVEAFYSPRCPASICSSCAFALFPDPMGRTLTLNLCRIAPLLKGLRIGEVTTKIHETQDMIIDMRKHAKKSKVSRDIAEDKFDVPQDQETALVDGQDSWVFTRQISLPKSLRECLQTVDALGIRTKHNLLFNVKLINPDEHVSEVTICLLLRNRANDRSSYMLPCHSTYTYRLICCLTRTIV